MQLNELIEKGAEKAGSIAALGRQLDLSREAVAHARAHKRPLPIDAAVRLADYIGEDLRKVIAANELATEKKEEKRAFWSPFVQTAKAASVALAITGVTFFVTPNEAQAAPLLNQDAKPICIM